MTQIVRDGEVVNVCAGCGADVGNASVAEAVTIHGMTSEGQPITLAVGTRCCVPKLERSAALRWRQSAEESPGAVEFYRPAGEGQTSGRRQRRELKRGSSDAAAAPGAPPGQP